MNARQSAILIMNYAIFKCNALKCIVLAFTVFSTDGSKCNLQYGAKHLFYCIMWQPCVDLFYNSNDFLCRVLIPVSDQALL